MLTAAIVGVAIANIVVMAVAVAMVACLPRHETRGRENAVFLFLLIACITLGGSTLGVVGRVLWLWLMT